MNTRRWLVLLVGVALSAGALAWVLSTVAWRDVMAAWGRVPLWAPLLAMAIYLVGFVPRAGRWRVMLRDLVDVPTIRAGEVVVIGYAANNLLPFRLGEAVRAWVLQRTTGAPFMGSLASIGAERILDGGVIVLLLGAATLWLSASAATPLLAEVTPVLWLGAVLFGGALAGLLLVALWSDRLGRWADQLLPARVAPLIAGILAALRFLREARRALAVVALTLVIWLVEGAMFGLLLAVMEVPSPWVVGYFCLALVNLGILLPSAPGYVGVFQAFTVLAFTLLGLDEATGLAFAVLVHVCQYLPVTLLGVLRVARLGLRWGTLARVRTPVEAHV